MSHQRCFPRALAGQVLTLVACAIATSWGQTYPRWFFEQGTVLSPSHVGYAQIGYYRDSAVTYALRNACENAVRNASTRIVGKREHWATEIGTFVMDDDIREIPDSSAGGNACELVAVDSFFLDHTVIVLAAPRGLAIPGAARTRIHPVAEQTPSWIQAPPDEEGFIYTTGLSAEYFYEKSSWLKAEQVARKNLAFSVFERLKSLQRVAEQGIEKSREEVEVLLHDVQVVARWRDLKNRIMHVLIRMPRI
jgi:hypothetical protein